MFVYCTFLVGNKDQGNVRIDVKKLQKMDAYGEAKQRVFATASVKFAVVKYILTAVRTNFTAARVSRTKGPGV